MSGGHELIGLAYDPLETGLYQNDLMKRAYQVPFPGEDWPGYMTRLSEIKARQGLDILIPGFNRELPYLISRRHDLDTLDIKILLPPKQSLEDLTSQKFRNVLKKHHTAFRPLATDVHGGSVVIRSLGKAPIQNTPAVHLVAEDAFSLALLAGRDHKIAGLAVMKKLQTSSDGRTWMGLSIDDGDFISLAEFMTTKTHWIGPMTVNLVRNAEGYMYIEDIYPLFPDWINFATECGANLPARLVDLLLGRKIPSRLSAMAGRLFVRAAIDIVTDIERLGIFSLEGEAMYDPH